MRGMGRSLRCGEAKRGRSGGGRAGEHVAPERRQGLPGGLVGRFQRHEHVHLRRQKERHLGQRVSDRNQLNEGLRARAADVGEIETIFVEEVDKIVNPIGAKGLGELGMVGIPAAIANAVYHATGKRIRDLPIRIEDLLEA